MELNWKAPEPSDPYLTGLKVSNSLSGSKVPFVPNQGNTVNWYGCGPTVYDAAHMGHARNYVSFDIIRRIMEGYFGYKVNMCMNITDIDDKIIARANEQRIPFDQLARFWENDFFIEMKKLKCKLPDVITRVSEYVPEIIAFIQSIVDHKYGYESQGSVYFDTAAFRANETHVYGRMEPWSVNDEARVLEGEGALGVVTEKKTPLDFALWKKAKAGEPSWPSPWGEGRPGWHIECSAMASDVLGFPLDVHSGGIDLRFPHHDNELAQTEACFDRPHWVNYFLHSGHLHIKGLKMSKSLKNFITIKHILTEYNPRVVRILALIHRWDQPMNYDPEGGSMVEPLEIDRVLTNFFENMSSILRNALKSTTAFMAPTDLNMNGLEGLNSAQKWRQSEKDLLVQYEQSQQIIHEALCDNFNTPLVMSKIQELVTQVNLYVRNTPEKEVRGPLLSKIADYIYGLLKLFGVTSDEEGTYNLTTQATGADDTKFMSLMDGVAGFRNEVRELSKLLLKEGTDSKSVGDKLLKLSDAFRDENLVEVGVRLEDKGEKGFMWKQSNKETLLKERQKKLEEDEANKAAKEKRLIELAEAKAKKDRESQIPPTDYYRLLRGEEFSDFDQDGLPTKLADGQAVSKGQREKMRKALDKHRLIYEKTIASM